MVNWFRCLCLGTIHAVQIGAFLTASPLLALDLKPEEIRAKTEEKPVSVLQKRYFNKAFRPEVGILFGQFLNEAYTNTEKRGLRLGLFFNEWIGAEVQYVDTSITASDDRKALDKLTFRDKEDPEKIVSPEPEVNRINSMIDTEVVFAPFYGKMSVLDTLIIYTDLYFGLGVAALDTDQGSKTALSMALGQRFYVFKSLSLRIDFRNHNFSEERGGKKVSRNAQSWDLGFSWFFF